MEKAKILVNTLQKRGSISPLVYGSFLEHLGRCIYGGIWAEKIRNGKFAGDDPNHCGVVVPWRPFGEKDRKKVYFTHDNTHVYAERQSQRIEIMVPHVEAGIQQDVVLNDFQYRVVCIVKGKDIARGLRLSLRKGNSVYAEKALEEIDTEWQTFEFEWTIDPSLEGQESSFTISFEGPGTLWIGYVSMMPVNKSWKGMRRDVLEAVKALRLATVRWPGGNFVSGYHWMDGIGPREKRPPRWDYAWGAWEPNDFGTDEFIEFCRFVGVEPYICVNMGTGTPEEAAAWVEYCNGDPSTRYGSLRAENGHPEPYGVRFWGVGNEMYGNWQTGHVDPETYGRKCLEFVRAMKATDPNIVLIAVGVNETGLSSGIDFYPWNERVLNMVSNAIDYLSAHHYAPGPELLRTAEKRPSDEELYYPIVGFPEEMKHILQEDIKLLERFSERKSIDLAYDEWNVWIDGNEKNGLEERYLLRDGLYAAGMLHAFFLFPERVRITNIAQLVNVLGVISTSETALVLTPLYWALKLYRDHFGPILLENQVECETFAIERIGTIDKNDRAPFLDAASSWDPEQETISLAVINRHREKAIATQVTIEGMPLDKDAELYVLSGKDALSRNTFEEPSTVKIDSSNITISDNGFTHSFPPHSVSILKFKMAKRG